MFRLALVVPSATYRVADFLDAARSLGADVLLVTDQPQTVDPRGRTLVVDLDNPAAAAGEIVAAVAEHPVDAVVGVDDHATLTAALAAERLGLPGSPALAVARAHDKAAMRDAFASAGVPQPAYRRVGTADRVAGAAAEVGFPCVLKATSLAASRGVIRADDDKSAEAAAARIRAILQAAGRPLDEALLVEAFVPGPEVALEGLLRDGHLDVLALFDKPDPLDGPFFEETIYVTPTRLSAATEAAVAATASRAAAALGLTDGPLHAELRLGPRGPIVIEVAARSIGGLCARTLRFGAGMSLEELLLRHALRLPLTTARERSAAGVMMLPIPAAGTLVEVGGQDAARAVPGIAGLEITIAKGRPVVPLPEGDRYLGFLFARGESAADVESALRRAHAALTVRIQT